MIEEVKKPFTFKQFEFLAATAVYIGSVFMLVYNLFIRLSQGLNFTYAPNIELFREHNLHYSYTAYYIFPQLAINTAYYCSFLFLNWGVDRLVKNWNTWKTVTLNIIWGICLALLTYVFVALSLSTADTWKRAYLFYDRTASEVYSIVFDRDFVFAIMLTVAYSLYAATKYILKYMLSSFYIGYKKVDIDYKKQNSTQVKRECLVALLLWFLWFAFFAHKTSHEFSTVFSEVVILGIAIYWFSFNILIPQALARKETFERYIIKIIGLLATSVVPVSLITVTSLGGQSAIIANIFTIGINLFFTAPVTWFLYQYRFVQQQELRGLKTALGQSTADLDFLRSQINPHFLFNALNTLYGTALQENAERTGEGIQKLGDMMRFMLQENHEDKILLTREVEYLENYIALQKLRTQTSPDIIIQTEIDEQPNGLKIAPMLLIPFIENAFKHGISLREPSHIKITLQISGDQLHFDVTNSIHHKTDNDPEKDKSGIGLENVKQRLQLLYPDSHELVIHQNVKEFFIHLSVTL